MLLHISLLPPTQSLTAAREINSAETQLISPLKPYPSVCLCENVIICWVVSLYTHVDVCVHINNCVACEKCLFVPFLWRPACSLCALSLSACLFLLCSSFCFLTFPGSLLQDAHLHHHLLSGLRWWKRGDSGGRGSEDCPPGAHWDLSGHDGTICLFQLLRPAQKVSMHFFFKSVCVYGFSKWLCVVKKNYKRLSQSWNVSFLSS